MFNLVSSAAQNAFRNHNLSPVIENTEIEEAKSYVLQTIRSIVVSMSIKPSRSPDFWKTTARVEVDPELDGHDQSRSLHVSRKRRVDNEKSRFFRYLPRLLPSAATGISSRMASSPE